MRSCLPLVLLSACSLASSLTISSARLPATPIAHTTAAVRLQTFTPDAPTITKPDALPETWVVPDTFTFPARETASPPFFRLTLFKSSQFEEDYVAGTLSKVVGIDGERAREIAKQAQSLGFAVVGEFVQEVAEMYAAALQEKGLVVDISEAK